MPKRLTEIERVVWYPHAEKCRFCTREDQTLFQIRYIKPGNKVLSHRARACEGCVRDMEKTR